MFGETAKPKPIAPANPQAATVPQVLPKQGSSHSPEIWAGIFEELKKQGANEDFIAGMMKEAEDLSQPELDRYGLNADRHRVVPFMPNKLTGAMAGGLAGGVMSNELGLDGLSSYILPVLGAFAGNHYLPHLMNRWKDPEGTGHNSINPMAAHFNNMQPLGQSEAHTP